MTRVPFLNLAMLTALLLSFPLHAEKTGQEDANQPTFTSSMPPPESLAQATAEKRERDLFHSIPCPDATPFYLLATPIHPHYKTKFPLENLKMMAQVLDAYYANPDTYLSSLSLVQKQCLEHEWWMGMGYYAHGDLSKAEFYLQRANENFFISNMSLSDQAYNTRTVLVDSLLHQNKGIEAIAAAERALTVSPEDCNTQLTLTRIWMAECDFARAYSILEHLLASPACSETKWPTGHFRATTFHASITTASSPEILCREIKEESCRVHKHIQAALRNEAQQHANSLKTLKAKNNEETSDNQTEASILNADL